MRPRLLQSQGAVLVPLERDIYVFLLVPVGRISTRLLIESKGGQSDSRRLSENGYFSQSLRQTQIIILKILYCIPVVIVFAFLDLEKTISFSDSLLRVYFWRHGRVDRK
jgi:hypothetical protein